MEREQPLSIVKGDSFSALLSVNYDNGDAYEFIRCSLKSRKKYSILVM